MAKVLLVDTNFSSRPIYDELERLGHEVHVVGANASDCLAKVCTRYWNLNYSDTDALQALIEKEQFAHLIPGCTDRSYSSCAVVSQGRFPGIESVKVDQTLNLKDLFRSLGQDLNLPVPCVQWKDGTNNGTVSNPSIGQLRWPLVVKPVDGFSGKGVGVLLQPEVSALQRTLSAARAASARGQCLIEDYVQGQLHSHSAFLHAGRVAQDVIAVEHSTANPFVVDTSRVLPMIDAGVRDKLRHAIEALAGALDLADGLIHTQFVLDGEQPWLIEVTRRCPGDLYSQLIELSGGAGYVSNYVRPFLGQPIAAQPCQAYIPIMRHTVTVPSAQGFDHLHFRQALLLERWVPLSLTGDRLQSSPASRIGILFARAEDENQLHRLYAKTLARQLYDVVH